MRLYKRGNIWWIEYQVDRKVYRQSTRSGNKAAARAFMDNIMAARKAPSFEDAVKILRVLFREEEQGAANGLPIDAMWETYLSTAKLVGKDTIEARTLDKRRGFVARFVKWLKKNRPTIKTVEGVTAPIAAGFAQELQEAGLKSKTRINIIGDLGTVWKMLGNYSAKIVSPWGNLRPQDIDGESGKAFTREHEELVLEASKRVCKHWHEVCLFMRYTGQRYGDAATLKWEAVDFAENTITIVPNKTKRHKIEVVLPMVGELREALWRIHNSKSEYVFPLHAKYYGNRGRASREALSFAEVLKAAGLYGKGYTVHSWRHTAATRLGAAGVDKETRKEILGHTTDAMAEHYDHDAHLDKKRRALESAI